MIILLVCPKTELKLKPGTQSIPVTSFGRVFVHELQGNAYFLLAVYFVHVRALKNSNKPFSSSRPWKFVSRNHARTLSEF